MVHYVIEAVDRGRPVVTQAVEIRTGDSLEDLEVRLVISFLFLFFFHP